MAVPAEEKNTGIRRILNAFKYSMHGFAACFKTEEAFQQEAVLALFMIPGGFWLGETPVEKILLVGTVMIVLMVELLNTGIERAIDRISFEKHELSKDAKDMGSAAVFLSLVMAGLCWVLIAGPKILALFS